MSRIYQVTYFKIATSIVCHAKEGCSSTYPVFCVLLGRQGQVKHEIG